jgi:hypothetical protein
VSAGAIALGLLLGSKLLAIGLAAWTLRRDATRPVRRSDRTAT